MPEQGANEPTGAALLAIRIANAVGKPFGINPFPRAFPNCATGNLSERAQIFDRIYTDNFWSSAESRSGVGSEGKYAEAYRRLLETCLKKVEARSLFDAPCGDLNWILPIARDPTIDYRGGDISPSLVAELRTQHPDIDLTTFDICSDAFPVADVWHCRDCLFHLPFADIERALRNFASSSIPYAMLTTHKARWHRNLDVAVGGFRYLDLERAPISLPPAEKYLNDFRPGRDFPRYVGVWRREAIAKALDLSPADAG